jgi:predicted nucleotide-binding protein
VTLSEFITQIPSFTSLSRTPTKLVPYFALFLELENPEAIIAPAALERLFDDARVRRPANTSDVIRKSKSFVRVKGGGYRLAHEARKNLAAALDVGEPTSDGNAAPPHAEVSEQDVFVVYGRDHRLRRDLFAFLRAVGLNPLEFDEMAHLTGSTSASTWQVIQAGFARAQACVVLFSPDEHVRLREDLRGDDDLENGEMQPRPNVLVEAGMALALHPKRTIIVKVGHVRDVSDLDGMQYVRLTQSADSRNRLISKLKLAGCDVKTHGDDWLNVGNFEPDAVGRKYGKSK